MNAEPFFSTVERILKLESVCESWRHTSFMPNAAVKGAGASCQKLVAAIYIECGALPPDFVADEGPMNWSHAHKDSLIEKFMEKYSAGGRSSATPQYFSAIPQSAFRNPQCGDMLGFTIGGCVHHSGVLFRTDGTFIHCLRPDGVCYNNIHDATYWTRLARVWRPVEKSSEFSVEPRTRNPEP